MTIEKAAKIIGTNKKATAKTILKSFSDACPLRYKVAAKTVAEHGE